jgi:hypothetical protein
MKSSEASPFAASGRQDGVDTESIPLQSIDGPSARCGY